jgi:hypothetical protein
VRLEHFSEYALAFTPEPPNHFLCYETHRPRLDVLVDLVDEFGSSTDNLGHGKRLCTPVDKNGEDPTAPTDPEHLAAYAIRHATSLPSVGAVTVQNQFGVVDVEVARPGFLLVPAAKSLSGPPQPLATPADRFKCYGVRGGENPKARVTLEDQFGTTRLQVFKPRWLCSPVEMHGEAIIDPHGHLLCYDVAPRSAHAAAARPARAPRRTDPAPGRREIPEVERVFALDEFGADEFGVLGPQELCVPSVILP